MWAPLLSALVWASACGGAHDPGPTGPKDGVWQGEELSFVLRDGVAEQVVVHKATCTGDEGCEVTYGAALTGTHAALPTLSIHQGDYRVEGTFTSRFTVSGSVFMGPEGGCCRVVGAWAANHVADLPGPGGADASGGSDGGVVAGSPDWQGASTGDLHPGPAHSLPPAEGSASLAPHQQAAHAALLAVRAAIGAGPVSQDAQLAAAAQAHADFYVQHAKKYQAAGLSPHAEDASFGDGFTGKSVGDRVKAAGFTGAPGAEVMAFTGTAEGAVRGWMETVYHRLPLVSPTAVLFGYGAAKGGGAATEVMDFSSRAPRKDDPVVVVPFPGETGVPRSWSGNEGPQPPPPPGGYPSGPVITARVSGATAWGSHALVDASGAPVPHVFLSADNDPNMKTFDRHSVALYAHEPLLAGATYTVQLSVTVDGKDRTLSWRFVTAD